MQLFFEYWGGDEIDSLIKQFYVNPKDLSMSHLNFNYDPVKASNHRKVSGYFMFLYFYLVFVMNVFGTKTNNDGLLNVVL